MTREIPLTQGKVALVDDEDFEHLSQSKWHASKVRNAWYACHKNGTTGISMHQLILGRRDGMMIDHIDRDTTHRAAERSLGGRSCV